MGTSSRTKIATIAALTSIWPFAAAAQQGGSSAANSQKGGAQQTVGLGGIGAQSAVTAAGMATPQAQIGSGTTRGGNAPAPRGGLQLDLGLSTKLSADDNFSLSPKSAGTSTISDTALSFGLSSVTPVQDLSVNGSVTYRYGNIPGRSLNGLDDPNLRFSYQRDSANSQLNLTGRYRHVRREFLDPFQIEQEEENSGGFYSGGGKVTYRNLGASFQTGINSPLGLTVSAGHDEKTYDVAAQQANPFLFSTNQNDIDGTLSLRVTPVTQVRLNAGYIDYNAEDLVDTHRQTYDLSLGLVQDINSVLQLDGQIGQTKVDTDNLIGGSNRDGTTGHLMLTKTLPLGTVFAAYDSALNQNGTRHSLSFGRNIQMPLGNLDLTFGGTYTPGGDTYWTGRLGYSRQMRDSDLSLSLNRTVSTNNSSQDILDTRVAVGYGYAINNNSRLRLNLNWGESESAGIGNASTIRRTTFDASYSRDITQDWALTGGLTIRQRSDSAATSDAQSNALYLTLGRNFSYRP